MKGIQDKANDYAIKLIPNMSKEELADATACFLAAIDFAKYIPGMTYFADFCVAANPDIMVKLGKLLLEEKENVE